MTNDEIYEKEVESAQDELEDLTSKLRELLVDGEDSLFLEEFSNLHEYEMGQVYVNLGPELRQIVWRLLDVETLGIVFDNISEDDEDIVELLEEMPAKLAASTLHNMYADNEADILSNVDEKKLAAYLSLLPTDEAIEMRKLVGYEDKTAGGLMSTEYLAVNEDCLVKEAMITVKKEAEEAEMITYVYVKDKADKLIGVVSLRELLINPDQMLIKDIMNDRVISVPVDQDQEEVAQLMADYDFVSMPVVDENNTMLGVITIDDIVDVMEEESLADYSGLAAVNVSDINDTPWHSAFKRIPWLIALLLLGMFTATVINSFDSLVKEASILAAFISLITGTAGNAGTQALALSVRRIATNEENNFWKNFFFELLSGIITGLTTGTMVFLLVTFWKHNSELGLAVGLAMTCAIFVANMAGLIIPIIMDKIGIDPAVASGPFISTLSDLTSVIIYFSIAQMFITHFVGTS